MWRGWWRWWRKARPPLTDGRVVTSGRLKSRASARCSGRGLRTQRRRMSRRWTSYPAAFEVDGRVVMGRMCNVSKTGVQIRLDGEYVRVRVKTGTRLDFTIKTSYGTVTRPGVVVWSHRKDEFRYLGVHFGPLPEGDPLAALADSPF